MRAVGVQTYLMAAPSAAAKLQELLVVLEASRLCNHLPKLYWPPQLHVSTMSLANILF